MNQLAPLAVPPHNGWESKDRLDSWKDVAVYLNRDVRTVQRWERREGMPIHRHLHQKLGSVYAFRPEIDAWRLTRSLPAAVMAPTASGVSPGG